MISIKNYVITEITVNITGYKANNDCLARKRDYFFTRSFDIPALRLEI